MIPIIQSRLSIQPICQACAGKGGGDQQPSGTGRPQPATISGPGDIAKLPRGQPFIIPSGPNQGKIGYAQ